MSREKGKRGEREVAALLRSHGFEAKRGQQHSGSPDSPDVVSDLPHFLIEVKRTERFQLYKALEQAEADCGLLDSPIVFHRTNDKAWVVVLKAHDFLSLMRRNK